MLLPTLSLEAFLVELAAQIAAHGQHPEFASSPEPYRAAGDSLVDAALDLVP